MLSRRDLTTGATALAAYSQIENAEAINRLLLLSGGIPSWVPNRTNPPDFAVNWAIGNGGVAWSKKVGITTPSALGITTTRASVKQVSDANGNWSQVPANVTATSALGRSTEESRTNSIRNNNGTGASGATAPTNWTYGGGGGLTFTYAMATINGVSGVAVTINGTDTTGFFTIFPDGNGTTIAAATGQAWNISVFMSLTGSFASLDNINFQLREKNSSNGAVLTDNGSNFFSAVSSSLKRFYYDGTSSGSGATLSGGGTVAFVTPAIGFNYTLGQVFNNVVLFFGWPQLEQGASVTSPIVTSGTALTRAADVTTLTGVATTGSALTLFSQAVPQTPVAYGSTQPVLALSDGTLNNRFQMYRSATGTDALITEIAGSSQTTGNSITWTQGATANIAASFSSGNQVESFNGSSVSGTLTGTLGGTTIYFGSRSDGGSFLDGLTLIDAVWLTQAIPPGQLRTLV